MQAQQLNQQTDSGGPDQPSQSVVASQQETQPLADPLEIIPLDSSTDNHQKSHVSSQSNMEVGTPLTQSNLFSFMDKANGVDCQMQSIVGNEEQRNSFAAQSSGRECQAECPRLDLNSQTIGSSFNLRNHPNIADNIDILSQDMMTPLPESRNLEHGAAGGQSAGVYGYAPDSGTLKLAANGASDNFRSVTTREQNDVTSFYGNQCKLVNQSTKTRVNPTLINPIENQRTNTGFKRHDEEDDDEPSLQSPHLQKTHDDDQCEEEKYKDVSALDAVTSPALSPGTGPKPEALSIKKSEKEDKIAIMNSPSPQKTSKRYDQNENEGHQTHLSESPSLPNKAQLFDQVTKDICDNNITDSKKETNQIDNQDCNLKNAIDNFCKAGDQNNLTRERSNTNYHTGLHKSDCKDSASRGIFDINVLDYNNTAKIGSGLIGFGELAEGIYNNGQQSGCKTARDIVSPGLARSKSHNSKSPYGAAMSNAPAELQAHIERLRMRSSLQHQQLPFTQTSTSFSPFQKAGRHAHPHFESLYQMQMQQNHLTAFDGQSQYSAALRSGNPLAQSVSMNHLNQLNATQQHLRIGANACHSQVEVESTGGGLIMAKQPSATGQQYEVLLKE